MSEPSELEMLNRRLSWLRGYAAACEDANLLDCVQLVDDSVRALLGPGPEPGLRHEPLPDSPTDETIAKAVEPIMNEGDAGNQFDGVAFEQFAVSGEVKTMPLASEAEHLEKLYGPNGQAD